MLIYMGTHAIGFSYQHIDKKYNLYKKGQIMKRSLFIILIIIPLFSFAQFEQYIEDDPEPTVMQHRGLAYSLLETGSGLGLFYELPSVNYFHFGLIFDAFMLRDNGQLDYINPYTGYPESYGKLNNVFLLDLMFTAKKRLFERTLHDSFRPFITASVGPVYGMNFREENAYSYYQIEKPRDQFGWTLGGIVGVGLDADVDGVYFFGLRAQYRFMPFGKMIGETKDHSMVDLRFEVGQRF